MIFESKFGDQNNMSHDKFLLDHLDIHFTRWHLTVLIIEGPKQYDFLTLGIKVRNFKE